MNKKSFILGMITGVILTIVTVVVIGIVNQNNDPVKYLEKPVIYENKTETSVKVFQVIGDAALAMEISNKKYDWFDGNMVIILGENYYSGQIIKIKNPKRVGTYSYTTKGGMQMTVPVIEGEITE